MKNGLKKYGCSKTGGKEGGEEGEDGERRLIYILIAVLRLQCMKVSRTEPVT